MVTEVKGELPRWRRLMSESGPWVDPYLVSDSLPHCLAYFLLSAQSISVSNRVGEHMPLYTQVRRWPRFVAYLPVECVAFYPGQSNERRLAGKTVNVGAGGLAFLLEESLPLGSRVLVKVCEEEPVRGHVVWTDQRTRAVLGAIIAHGVAFEQPVDPARVGEWVRYGERRSNMRAPVKFDVEYAHAGGKARGTCLNVSQGGMFIATEGPVAPGTEVMLRLTPPGVFDPLSVPARVAWVSRDEAGRGAITGMGVQYLDLKPFEAAVIGNLVDHHLAEMPNPNSF